MIAERTIDVYSVTVHLITTKHDLLKLRKRLDFLPKRIEDSGYTQFAQVYRPGSLLVTPHVVVWIDEAQHERQAELIETAAHEATHAAGAIMEHVGHKVSANDEPFAWLVGWLTAWLVGACDAVG